jgi:hypothetical protein
MNGFLVGDAGDVEKQKLFVERPGDFIVAKHLPLEHRWSDAAADSNGDRSSEQVEAHATHEVTEFPFGTPDSRLRCLGFRLRGHGDDDRGCSSRDRTLQTPRVTIARGYANLVHASSRPRFKPTSGKDDWAVDAEPPGLNGIGRSIRRKAQGKRHSDTFEHIPDETLKTTGSDVRCQE